MATLLIIAPIQDGSIALDTPETQYPYHGFCLMKEDLENSQGIYFITGTQEQMDAIAGNEVVTILAGSKEEMRQPEFSIAASTQSAVNIKGGGKLGDKLPSPKSGPFDDIDLTGFGIADPEEVEDGQTGEEIKMSDAVLNKI